jgi:hypothetical protein
MLLSLPLLQGTVQLNIGEEAQTAELSGATSTFGDFVSSILQGAMVVAALLLLLFLIWAAIDWITAGGDSGKIEKARQKITQSIIGIIVLASVVALFTLVQNFLGIKIFNFDTGSAGPTGPRSSVLDRSRSELEEAAERRRINDILEDRLPE